MLTTFYPPYNFGGDGIGIKRLATALADRGHAITVIHDKDAYMALATSAPAPIEEDPRIEVIQLSSPLGTFGSLLTHQFGSPVVHAKRLKELLAKDKFDVIWFHNVSLVGGPGLLGIGDAIKIYEAHEHWLVCPTHVLWRENTQLCEERHCLRCTISYRRPPQLWRWTGKLEREASHVDAFIAKSNFSRDKHSAFGFAPDMQVVPYFLPDMPPASGAPSPHSRPYFLFVGRLEKIKGVQDIIPAFAGDEGPDLLVVGSGDYEATLREQAVGHPRVRFVGRLNPEEIPAYYEHARALIVPSICYETFGIILIEAFRSGTPVIARRIGPFPEIIARGGGLMFENEDELRSAIAELGEDAVRRDNLAQEARRAFETHWTEDVVMEQYLNVVRQVACNRGNERVMSALGGSK
ncbi:MAG: glycosyltransferase family 4 protein [Sphingobium sp.]